MIINNPNRPFHPNGSPKWSIPTAVATMGSNDPSIEVMVDPACFTAATSARLDTTVAKTASPAR